MDARTNLSSLTDGRLMEMYQAGNNSAFEILYERKSAKIWSFIKRRLHSNEDAEEVFQKALMKFHKSKARYDRKYSVDQWLFVIARSELNDFLRAKVKQRRFFESVDDLQHLTFGESESTLETRSMVNEALSDLKLIEREALEMRYLRESEYEEIALIIGTTAQSGRKIVSRALSKLRLKFAAAKESK